MARSRNIKPGFYKNEDLAECSVWARYIFPGLWMLADREGRLEDRPKRIKGDLLPYDGHDVEPLLAELAARKDAQGVPFIIRYQNSDGRFIQISKFLAHQSPHYSEKKSVIKPPEPRESLPHDAEKPPGVLQEHPEKKSVIKKGSQPPDSLIHRFSDSPTADSLNPEPRVNQPPSAAAKKTAAPDPGKSVETWNAYSGAYRERYTVDPIRNSKVNGQLAKLVDQLGSEEAPRVAEFYLTHNGGLYVSSGHCVDLLLRDCAKLRTEMLTGRKITRLESRNAEAGDALRAQVDRVGLILEASKS